MKKLEGSSEDRLVGKQLGDYQLKRLLATGGMARIYEAVDTRLGRTAAVKVLSVDNPADDRTLTQRFQREAKAIARLEHPNIITIYQYGEELGLRFLAMKYIDGKDLALELARLRRSGQKMEPARAIAILEQVASALDFAHMHEIVHRDVKPSNILLDRSDRAVLTDFGLILQTAIDQSSTKTHGTAFGTPRYIAPEQAMSSANAVPQSDTYSLAVILYEILTGEAPFTGETPMEIALGHIGDPPRPPRSVNSKIPVGVEKEILKALEKDPKRRHESASAFVNAIKAAYQREQPDALRGMAQFIAQPPSTITEIGEDRPTNRKEWLIGDGSTNRVETSPGAIAAEVEKRKRRLSPLWWVLGFGLVLLIGWVIAARTMSSSPIEADVITLWYDADSMIIYNGHRVNLNTFSLQFIRGLDGEGGDDFSGDRFPNSDTLPAGRCYTIYLLGDQEPGLPEVCGRLYGFEQLGDVERLFWRQEPVRAQTFDVVYDRQVITQCPTVSDGEQQTCTFTWLDPTITPAS